jgi:hypothetical protein
MLNKIAECSGSESDIQCAGILKQVQDDWINASRSLGLQNNRFLFSR